LSNQTELIIRATSLKAGYSALLIYNIVSCRFITI